jgi:hypothetical protein
MGGIAPMSPTPSLVTPASKLEMSVHGTLQAALHLERRFEPWFRPALNAIFREPSAWLLQALINFPRRNEGLKLAEEKPLPDEEAAIQGMIDYLGTYMREHWKPGNFQRGGNTKTHGIVRGEFIVRDDVPSHMRRGIFAKPQNFRAWVRFAGPGPDIPKDIEDVGFASCSFKLMGVPGPKLMDDEKFTQDFTSVSTPTFVTPDVKANAALQAQILRGTPIFYFWKPGASHILDFFMQALWNETQTSPLEARYWSTVPYLLGDGQAMMFSVRPKLKVRSRIAGLPFHPADNYLRDALRRVLDERDAEFDFLVQVQTDSHRMPIEHAGVRWPEKLSPFVPVATLRLPRQKFDSPKQFAFANNLSINPWHCIPEHRPLGNQSRGRHRMYWELSQLRQRMNNTPHVEPTGDEVFD